MNKDKELTEAERKPVHVKPSLYALYYYELKEAALKYGYNLVLHGSLARDMDLIAIPWAKDLGSMDAMITEFCDILGATEMVMSPESKYCLPHGRISYVINLNRRRIEENHHWFKKGRQEDLQYYLDISVLTPGAPLPSKEVQQSDAKEWISIQEEFPKEGSLVEVATEYEGGYSRSLEIFMAWNPYKANQSILYMGVISKRTWDCNDWSHWRYFDKNDLPSPPAKP